MTARSQQRVPVRSGKTLLVETRHGEAFDLVSYRLIKARARRPAKQPAKHVAPGTRRGSPP